MCVKPRRASPLTTAGYVTLSIGSTGIVVGAVMQGLASKSWADGNSAESYSDFENHRDRLKGYQTGALTGLIAGGIAAGAGIVMIVLGRRDTREGEVAVWPGPNGVLAWGRF